MSELLLPERSIEMSELSKTAKKILKMLTKRKAMPFLELESMSEIPEDELAQILEALEKKDLVRVHHRGNVFEQIVTATSKAFA